MRTDPDTAWLLPGERPLHADVRRAIDKLAEAVVLHHNGDLLAISMAGFTNKRPAVEVDTLVGPVRVYFTDKVVP